MVASPAHAESPADLQARGEDQARQGHYTEAIDSFKAADRLEPSAAHACLIALAYVRREHLEPGTALTIGAPDGPAATVRALPF